MTREILLTKGKVALVDDEDFERVSQHRWNYFHCDCREGYGYAHARIDGKHASMHRFILNPLPHLLVDHIDGDPLNNTRANMRTVTHAENMQNSRLGKNNKSGYKGVCWHVRYKKWEARIMADRRDVYLGRFDDLKDAVIAYNEAALRLHGEFAWANPMDAFESVS